MGKAPERIWADPDHWLEKKPCRTGYTEYTRADLSHALIAAKLHEAADIAENGAACKEAVEVMRALIDTDHQAALDAYVRREVEKERERCAKIADNMAARAEEQKERYRGGSNPWDRYRVLAAHYSNVAAAIREAVHE